MVDILSEIVFSIKQYKTLCPKQVVFFNGYYNVAGKCWSLGLIQSTEGLTEAGKGDPPTLAWVLVALLAVSISDGRPKDGEIQGKATCNF